MSQANVVTSAANVIWYTDKAEIVTGATTVTYQIYEVALPPTITFSGTTTNGSNVIATSAAMYLPANSAITGTGIAANTTISSQVQYTSVTVSANATANATSVFTVTTPANGNMYSAPPQISANSRQQIFVGAGNYLTITGANFTAREIGTASSATAGVNGTNYNANVVVTPPGV
jgi:hypothetical protein